MGKIFELKGRHIPEAGLGHDEQLYPVTSVHAVYVDNNNNGMQWSEWWGDTMVEETKEHDGGSGGERGRIWSAIRSLGSGTVSTAQDIAEIINGDDNGYIDTAISGLGYVKSAGAQYEAGTGISIDGNVISAKAATAAEWGVVRIGQGLESVNGSLNVSVEPMQADWSNSNPDSYGFIRHKPVIPSRTSDLINDSGFITDISGKVDTSMLGVVNGVATLSADGKVPSAQLPSFVDDIIEYTSVDNFPATGESGKIYVATSTNLAYRWGGSTYVEISSSLALGETSGTAYRGDRGKVAFDHASAKGTEYALGLYKISTNGEGHVITAQHVTKNDIVSLGIPGEDTVYGLAGYGEDGLMSSSDKDKLDSVSPNAEMNVQSDWNEDDDHSDAFIKNKPRIPGVVTSWRNNPTSTDVVSESLAKGLKDDIDILSSDLNDLMGIAIIKENVDNKVTSVSSLSTDTEYPSAKCLYDGLAEKVDTTLVGTAYGIASLGANGKVPDAQLPDYDDVMEYLTVGNFPATGKAGSLYIATSTNIIYRWNGNVYTPILPVLGETMSTAYRGDRGKTAYDHAVAKGSAFSSGLYKIATNAEGHVTAAESVTKGDITALGIPAQDTTYSLAGYGENGLMSSSDKDKLDGIEAGAQANVQPDWEAGEDSDAYIQNKPYIPTKTSDLYNDAGFLTTHQDISHKMNLVLKGAQNGVAPLNSSAIVPDAYLPAYVKPTELNTKVNRPLNLNGTFDNGTSGQVLATYGDGTTYWRDMGSGGGGSATDYADLDNKPSINSVTLSGNKSASDLGLASATHTHTVSQITDFPDLTGYAAKATTLAGYGITDAKISSGTITLGSNTITPLVAADISGKIDWPQVAGTDGQVLATNGSGGVYWKTVSSGGEGGGTTDYSELDNHPYINGVELYAGNNTLQRLGIAAASHTHDFNSLQNVPVIPGIATTWRNSPSSTYTVSESLLKAWKDEYDILAQDVSDLFGIAIIKENVSNKVTTLSAMSDNMEYPSAKCVYDGLRLKVNAPSDNGTSGQVLATAGDGTTYWLNLPGGGGGSGDAPTYAALPDKPSINGHVIVGAYNAEHYDLAHAAHNHDGLYAKVSDLSAVAFHGDYVELSNKPSINSVVLTGNQRASDLGLADRNHTHAGVYATPADLSSYVHKTNDVNVANGVAPLDSSKRLPDANLPLGVNAHVNDSSRNRVAKQLKLYKISVTDEGHVGSTEEVTIPQPIEYGLAEQTSDGLMSASDKLKLDGIEAGAQANVKPDWSAAAGDAAEVLNKPMVNNKALAAGNNTLSYLGIPELGITHSSAYYGDLGKVAYDHSQSAHARADATKTEAGSTNGYVKINGTDVKVYEHPSGTNPHGTTKADVGLGNVGNFKAVSTEAGQGLTNTEKSNARTNIGAGSSDLALGTTSSTAFRGDRGQAAYLHATDSSRMTTAQTVSKLYKLTVTAEGHVASLDEAKKADIVAMGIPAQDTTYQPASQIADEGLMTYAESVKLGGIESGAQVNVQADWNQTDNTRDDYIKNKPTIPSQVKPDWNAASGAPEEILNKPGVVSAWSATPLDTNIASEKLVHDTLPVEDITSTGAVFNASAGTLSVTLPTNRRSSVFLDLTNYSGQMNNPVSITINNMGAAFVGEHSIMIKQDTNSGISALTSIAAGTGHTLHFNFDQNVGSRNFPIPLNTPVTPNTDVWYEVRIRKLSDTDRNVFVDIKMY